MEIVKNPVRITPTPLYSVVCLIFHQSYTKLGPGLDLISRKKKTMTLLRKAKKKRKKTIQVLNSRNECGVLPVATIRCSSNKLAYSFPVCLNCKPSITTAFTPSKTKTLTTPFWKTRMPMLVKFATKANLSSHHRLGSV